MVVCVSVRVRTTESPNDRESKGVPSCMLIVLLQSAIGGLSPSLSPFIAVFFFSFSTHVNTIGFFSLLPLAAGSPAKPLGLLDCQRQVSSHILSTPRVAVHLSCVFAFWGFA